MQYELPVIKRTNECLSRILLFDIASIGKEYTSEEKEFDNIKLSLLSKKNIIHMHIKICTMYYISTIENWQYAGSPLLFPKHEKVVYHFGEYVDGFIRTPEYIHYWSDETLEKFENWKMSVSRAYINLVCLSNDLVWLYDHSNTEVHNQIKNIMFEDLNNVVK